MLKSSDKLVGLERPHVMFHSFSIKETFPPLNFLCFYLFIIKQFEAQSGQIVEYFIKQSRQTV